MGRSAKYDEETKLVSVRLPLSTIAYFTGLGGALADGIVAGEKALRVQEIQERGIGDVPSYGDLARAAGAAIDDPFSEEDKPVRIMGVVRGDINAMPLVQRTQNLEKLAEREAGPLPRIEGEHPLTQMWHSPLPQTGASVPEVSGARKDTVMRFAEANGIEIPGYTQSQYEQNPVPVMPPLLEDAEGTVYRDGKAVGYTGFKPTAAQAAQGLSAYAFPTRKESVGWKLPPIYQGGEDVSPRFKDGKPKRAQKGQSEVVVFQDEADAFTDTQATGEEPQV